MGLPHSENLLILPIICGINVAAALCLIFSPSQRCFPMLLSVASPSLSGWTAFCPVPSGLQPLARMFPRPSGGSPAFLNGQTGVQLPSPGLSSAKVPLQVWLGIRMGKEATSSIPQMLILLSHICYLTLPTPTEVGQAISELQSKRYGNFLTAKKKKKKKKKERNKRQRKKTYI